MKLFVDDMRMPPSPGWSVVRSYSEAIIALRNNPIEVLSLDNDLGEEKEGWEILNWIEREIFINQRYIPPKVYVVHSMNPVARIRMYRAIDAIIRMIAKKEKEGE